MPSNGNRGGRPISSALLRRLAEAADGYRNRGPVFFLARPKENPESPTLFDISQAYKEEVLTTAQAKAMGAAATEPQSQEPLTELAPADREKFQKFLEGEESGERVFDLFGPFDTDDGKQPGVVITEIVLKVKKVDSDQEATLTIPTLSEDGEVLYDCVFWSLSAVQKFAVPYYTRVSGTEVANKMEASFIDDAFFFTAHKPVTEWTNLAAPNFAALAGGGSPFKLQVPAGQAVGKNYRVTSEGEVEADDVML